MSVEIVVAYLDKNEACVDEVIPGGYKSIENFSGDDRTIMVVHGLTKDSGAKIYSFSGEDIPKDLPPGAIPSPLLNGDHMKHLLGPGGVHESEIIRKSGRAARVIIMFHTS